MRRNKRRRKRADPWFGDVPKTGERRMTEIRSVGVIGAGQMGTGIAQVFAQAGYTVLLNDIDAKKLEAGLGGIALQLDKMVAREKLAVSEHAATLSRLSGTQDLAELGAADLIVESATEHE